MRVVLHSTMACEEVAARLSSNPAVELTVAEGMAQVLEAVPAVEVLVVATAIYDRAFAEALSARATHLKFIQLISAGYEGPQTYGVPAGVRVANAGEAWSSAVAEHALALLLALVKCLREALAGQQRHVWERSQAPRMTTLDGATVCVVGFGSIGREIARRARAFGARIVGVSRSGRPHPLADDMLPVSDLESALSGADAIVLSVPYSPGCEGMMGEAQFAA
jgi:phosphoglycerate dehydrogenase-like enzyme